MKLLLKIIVLLSVVSMRSMQADAQGLRHGSRHEKNIALTFDACPSFTHGGFDGRIIQTLVDSGIPATFFLSGRWIKKHSNEVTKLASIPAFEIGNHSFSHPHLTALSDDSIKQELEQTESLLRRSMGTSAKLFRPPYGETNLRIDSIAQSIGLSSVEYDLASGDPDSTISRDHLIRYVVSHVRNGSIIVMHVNGRGWHTSEALPEIIQALRAKGYIFSKVSDLLRGLHGASNSSADRKNH